MTIFKFVQIYKVCPCTVLNLCDKCSGIYSGGDIRIITPHVLVMPLQEGQCSATVELSVGAAESKAYEAGYVSTAPEGLPGNALYLGLDG